MTADMSSRMATVHNGDITLHYIAAGRGTPVVFVHGGLADYREFEPLAEALPLDYRVIRYSRRHSQPNDNGPPDSGSGMAGHVADLATLIRSQEGLAPVHLVGASYGALTALMLGLEHPELVRSIVAAEPPILHLLHEIDGGRAAYDDFMRRAMEPSRAAFAAGDAEGALRVAMEYFVGPGGLEQLPKDFRSMLFANIEDWRAIVMVHDALPAVSREALAALNKPVLLVSGSASAAVHRLIDPELLRVLPNARRVVVQDGTHDMCVEQPKHCARIIDEFIKLVDGEK